MKDDEINKDKETRHLKELIKKFERSETELKRAEEALIREKQFSDSIVDNTPAGIAFLDNDFILRRCNHTYAELIRTYSPYTPEQALGMSYFDYAPGSRPQVEEWFRKVRDTRKVDTRYGFKLVLKHDGQEKTSYWETSVAPLLDLEGETRGILILTQDVTERKNAEEELKNSQAQLRNLVARLQSIREEERRLIAREIHDELGQSLTALKMDLYWLKNRIPKDQKSQLEKTKSMSKLIDKTIQRIKRISAELRPGLLDYLGLPAAVEWEGKEFQNRTGIKCEVNIHSEDITLDQDRSTAVFRIFQETLTNAARHANATRVKVSLKEKTGKLELQVRDNGKGITEEQISDPKSFGLIGMRERAQFLGGEVEIKGVQDKGTTVTARIPFPKKGKTR